MLQETLVTRALMVEGLCYGDPQKRQAYKAHLFPGDSDQDADIFASGMASCLLHGRGLLAADEVDGVVRYHGQALDVLRGPYAAHIGEVEGLLQQLARARGLLVTSLSPPADVEALLKPGAVLVHGQGGSLPPAGPGREALLRAWGGVVHGLFVTGVEPRKVGWVVESVDGGQVDLANRSRCTAIRKVSRLAVHRPDGSWWVGSRRFAWGFDAGALPLRA